MNISLTEEAGGLVSMAAKAYPRPASIATSATTNLSFQPIVPSPDVSSRCMRYGKFTAPAPGLLPARRGLAN